MSPYTDVTSLVVLSYASRWSAQCLHTLYVPAVGIKALRVYSEDTVLVIMMCRTKTDSHSLKDDYTYVDTYPTYNRIDSVTNMCVNHEFTVLF